MEQHIGENISKARQNQKMTQEEFASRIGVTPQAVSKWEREMGLPDISLLEGICKVLKISADELLGITSEARLTEENDIVMQREIKNNMIAEPLLLEIGSALIPVVADGIKTDTIDRRRKKLVAENGYLMPLVRIRDNMEQASHDDVVNIYHSVVNQESIKNVDENTFEALAEMMMEICRENYAKILNKQLVKVMVDNVKELYPGVADGLVPEKIGYLKLERELQNMIREKGDIRDLIHILEKMESDDGAGA